MRKELLKEAKIELNYQKKIRNIFQNKLEHENPSLNNHKYIKLLAKLNKIDRQIDFLKSLIKQNRRQYFIGQRDFGKKVFVTIKSKVKLVSVDFQVVLWLDAKNTSDLIGKRLGEIINLYNSSFKIAGIY